ncbi:unnamed protein product [Ilex paraguariensis]|uniref:Uncharacterized protein n=1 Tax=Ilex paraguariensis TaxID=185542 RepID=A0ABC8TJA6_9AQUA
METRSSKKTSTTGEMSDSSNELAQGLGSTRGLLGGARALGDAEDATSNGAMSFVDGVRDSGNGVANQGDPSVDLMGGAHVVGIMGGTYVEEGKGDDGSLASVIRSLELEEDLCDGDVGPSLGDDALTQGGGAKEQRGGTSPAIGAAHAAMGRARSPVGDPRLPRSGMGCNAITFRDGNGDLGAIGNSRELADKSSNALGRLDSAKKWPSNDLSRSCPQGGARALGDAEDATSNGAMSFVDGVRDSGNGVANQGDPSVDLMGGAHVVGIMGGTYVEEGKGDDGSLASVIRSLELEEDLCGDRGGA